MNQTWGCFLSDTIICAAVVLCSSLLSANFATVVCRPRWIEEMISAHSQAGDANTSTPRQECDMHSFHFLRRAQRGNEAVMLSVVRYRGNTCANNPCKPLSNTIKLPALSGLRIFHCSRPVSSIRLLFVVQAVTFFSLTVVLSSLASNRTGIKDWAKKSADTAGIAATSNSWAQLTLARNAFR